MNNIVKYEDFSNFQQVDESEESVGLNHFEEACLAEGIEFSDWESLNEQQLYEKGKFLKGIGKVLGKVAGSLTTIAGPILKNLGIPGGGAIAGILAKVGKGLSTLKPKEGEKISVAAKENPEMKQVSDVVKGTLDKVLKEVSTKGPEALFSKANRESVLSLAAVMKTLGQANSEVKREAGPTPKAPAGQPAKTSTAATGTKTT